MDVITSCTCYIISTIGQSTFSTLIICSLPISLTNCAPLSTVPYSRIGDAGQKTFCLCTPRYWWDDINSVLSTNHLMPSHNSAIRDSKAYPTSTRNSFFSTK